MAIDRRTQARELATAHLMALAAPPDPMQQALQQKEAGKRSAIYEASSSVPQPVSTNMVDFSGLNAPPSQQTEPQRLLANDIRRRLAVQGA